MNCRTDHCQIILPHTHHAHQVAVKVSELQRLEQRSRELDDYLTASKLMRTVQPDMIAAAGAGSRFAEGWLTAYRDWNAHLLAIMESHQ